MADSNTVGAVNHRTPLWRTDGAHYGRSDIAPTAGGGLDITQHEMDAADLFGWSEGDREVGLSLSPAAAASLAIALLRDRFGGRTDAVEAINDYCEINGIAATLKPWT